MAKKRKIRVRKSDGRVEDFKVEKLRASLRRAGADPAVIGDLVEQVLEKVGNETSTGEIYRRAHSLLRRMDRGCGMRYTLKRALFLLGPTGYPFERYIADIFEEYGFHTKVGVTIRGRCVAHEVDVLAVNEEEVRVMECKYHNSKGTTTDVKVALYVHSRIRDLEPQLTAKYPGREYTGWLVTNTRCSADALGYARCAGLKVLSWKQPKERSLEEMIEARKLYPVTIVSGIQSGLVRKLIEERILLLRDLLKLSRQSLQKRLGLSSRKAEALKERAEALCG